MKKSLIAFIVAGLVLLTTGLWFSTSVKEFNSMNLLHLGVLLLIVGFAIFLISKRLTNAKRSEPHEDELSLRIRNMASSRTYYVSLFLWLIIGYFSDKISLEPHTLIGIGIISMAILFAGFWLYFQFKGNINE